MSLESSRSSVSPEFQLRSNYRPDIDGLRALAIIPVVIFHAFPSLMPGGFVGVDIFFVISGFLISRIILQAMQNGTFSFASFYANRIRRLFPALFLVLAVCFAFGWFFLLADEYKLLGKHMFGAAAYIENFILRREAGYFDVSSYLKPLMHLWSLGIEEQFYLTYPLVLWLVWRLRLNPLAIVVSLGALSFWLNIRLIHRDPVSAFYFPQTRGWELMAGCAIACWESWRQGSSAEAAKSRATHSSLPLRFEGERIANVFSAIGLALIAVAIFRINEDDPFPGWWALLPVCGASLLILGGSGLGGPGAWINRRILANKAMVFVGLISYPLYLWHWPILAFPRMIHGRELPVTVRIAGVLLSLVLAWTTWRYIERPIRFGHKTWIKTAALLAVSAAMFELGLLTYHRDGFSGRFPNLTADLGAGIPLPAPDCQKMIGAEIDYCRVPAPGPPDALLIGDSHAVSLYPGLAAVYHEHSQILMNAGDAGCLPFYDTDEYSGVRAHEDCRPIANRILQFAESSPSVRTIIFSLRGPLYMSGYGFGEAEKYMPHRKILWDGAAKDATESEVFTAAMRNTISRLSTTGKQLIVFIDWPEIGFDPKSCLQRPVSFFSHPRALCGVPRAEVDARNREYREFVAGLKNEFQGLHVFDPFPFLCDSSACYGMNASHVLYRDSNHLSAAGATYLSQKFSEEQSFR